MYICSIMANKYHIIFKFIDRINEDGPQTLEWSKSSGPRLTKDKWPKGGLWLLLLKHEWQWKDGDREDETGKDMGLKILWKTFMEGCPTRSCQLFIEVLIPSNAHIIWRENYQAVLRSSTTKKKREKFNRCLIGFAKFGNGNQILLNCKCCYTNVFVRPQIEYFSIFIL